MSSGEGGKHFSSKAAHGPRPTFTTAVRSGAAPPARRPPHRHDQDQGRDPQGIGQGGPPENHDQPDQQHHHNNNNHQRTGCNICHDAHPPYWATTQCNHNLCLRCAVRLRSLYGNKSCPLCKSTSEKILASRERREKFGEGVAFQVSGDGLCFEDQGAKGFVQALMEAKCPAPGCERQCRDKQAVKAHLIKDHRTFICDVCWEHRRAFLDEVTLYNARRDLVNHQHDDHPKCPSCAKIFYGEDELGEHCLRQHELCHLCDRERRAHPVLPVHLSPEERREIERKHRQRTLPMSSAPYFFDYPELEQHFQRAHFPCLDPLCKEAKFVVFASQLEFRAHQVEMHGVGGRPGGAGHQAATQCPAAAAEDRRCL